MALPGSNWTNPDVPWVYGEQITEVDMVDAGMTVVRLEGLLPPAEIARLEAIPKGERAVEIGRMSRRLARQGGRTLSGAISEGIAARVEAMLAANGVPRSRIVSIKRDAVFVAGAQPSRLRLPDGTQFRAKASYTAFARLGRVEFYCSPRRGSWSAKGISDELAARHASFSAELALDVLRMLEAGDGPGAAATLCQFRRDYAALRLPDGFYREFNAASAYCVRRGNLRFRVDEIGGFSRQDLDVAHNLHAVLLPLVRIVA